MKAIVSLIPLDSYDDQQTVARAVHDALEPFGGIAAIAPAGSRVLLKPNFVAPALPEQAITTHPAIVRALINELKTAGTTAIDIGDGPGVSDAVHVAKSCGIADVASELGATVVNFKDTVVYETLENRIFKRIELTDELQKHDVLITLPKLKTHVLMSMTCALKNQYGLVPGMGKARHHFRFQNRNQFADLVIDINRTAKPAFALVDAVIGMEGNGPSGGNPRKIGVLLAGTDLAAVDTVAAALIHMDPETVPLIQAARRGEFGATRLEDIEIRGAQLKDYIVADFAPAKAQGSILHILPLPNWALRWLRRNLNPRPHIDRKKCIRCGRCKNGCPVTPPAINPFGEHGPTLNNRTCIRCYCCHEFCPVKAIDLKRSAIDRIFHLVALGQAAHAMVGFLAGPLLKLRAARRRHRSQ